MPHACFIKNPNHPARCKAFLKKYGRQCYKIALKGSNFCQKHGGTYRKKTNQTIRRDRLKVPRFYSRHLGPTLKEAFEQALAAPSQEQLQVFEELALIRIAAGESVALFSAAQELPASDKKNAILQMAQENMREALGEVVKTCSVAASIDAHSKDKLSLAAVQMLVDQILIVAYDAFGEENQLLAERFEKLVRERVKLPKAGDLGTTLTPDADVAEMDNTVPRLEDRSQGDDAYDNEVEAEAGFTQEEEDTQEEASDITDDF